jgi:hypothetical protein
MEARTSFRGTAVSKKGFGVTLMAVIVAIGALLAIALASASAKPSATAPAIAPGTFVGAAALSDRESGQPVGAYVAPANGHGQLP